MPAIGSRHSQSSSRCSRPKRDTERLSSFRAFCGFATQPVEGAPGVVVTFVTKLSKRDDERLRTGNPNVDINRAARLDAIILADAGYLDTIWGDAKLRHKTYKPIRWGMPRQAALAFR